MENEALKADILRLYSQRVGRSVIANMLNVPRGLVAFVIDQDNGATHRPLRYPWLPADDDSNLPGGGGGYLPTTEQIQRDCRMIRFNKGDLPPEEMEAMRA